MKVSLLQWDDWNKPSINKKTNGGFKWHQSKKNMG